MRVGLCNQIDEENITVSESLHRPYHMCTKIHDDIQIIFNCQALTFPQYLIHAIFVGADTVAVWTMGLGLASVLGTTTVIFFAWDSVVIVLVNTTNRKSLLLVLPHGAVYLFPLEVSLSFTHQSRGNII